MAEFNLSYTAEDINRKLGKIDTLEQDVNKLNNEKVDKANLVYVTPQMFGAVGDGVADDTAAVQSALDNGGLIYFPAGRYKVTSLLTASKSCRIEMLKQYPSNWESGDTANYPLTADDNWMGSRIESYSPNGGLKIFSDVEVDGLYLRAMDGFSGVLLTYDDSSGFKSYPATTRLSHIRLDIEEMTTIPTSMFDFKPNGCYNYILDDITIGRMWMTFSNYGFRVDIADTPSQWANSVFIKNMCIDMRPDYPLYINGTAHTSFWQFDGLFIQTYPYDNVPTSIGKTGHLDVVTLKNMQNVLFTSCHIYDLVAADYSNVFVTEGLSHISCIGCGEEFESIETEFSAKMAMAKNFNISRLQMDLVTDTNTGENTLTLSDGTNKKQVIIPAAVLSDEQVANGVETWMDENAAPTYVVGKNKFDPSSPENINGVVISGKENTTSSYSSMFTTHYIPVTAGDAVRTSINGKMAMWYSSYTYDANKNFIRSVAPEAQTVTIQEGEAYVRNCYTLSTIGASTFADIQTVQLCIMLNSWDPTYEPYTVTAEGGLASYLVLSAPDGTKYTLTIDANGFVMADPVGDGDPITPDFTLTDEDKTAITNNVLANLTTEDWVFTLEDDTTLTKKVVVK